MKRIIIGFVLLAFMIFLCASVEAQGTNVVFDENTAEQKITFTTYTNTETFNLTKDNITIQSDLSVLPLEGNILTISIKLTKPKTDDYFIYELKDPENKLTSMIDRIAFNRPPMAIKDGELAWRVAGNSTELHIQGTVEPASPLFTEDNTAAMDWSNNTMFITADDFQQNSREPRISERVSLGIKDRIDILRNTVGFKQITVFALFALLLVGLLVWYYKKRNVIHDKLYSKTSMSSRNNHRSIDGDIITKQLEKHESL